MSKLGTSFNSERNRIRVCTKGEIVDIPDLEGSRELKLQTLYNCFMLFLFQIQVVTTNRRLVATGRSLANVITIQTCRDPVVFGATT